MLGCMCTLPTILALMYPNAAIAVSLEAYPCCFLTAIPFTATPFTATSFRTSLQSFCTLVSRCGCSVLHQLILRHHWQMSKLNHFIKYILEPCHPLSAHSALQELLHQRSMLYVYTMHYFCVVTILCFPSGDDRNIVKVFVAGREVKGKTTT